MRARPSIWSVLQYTLIKCDTHNVPELGAALAYYAVLSLAPMLVVIVGIAGLVFRADEVRGDIVYHVRNLVGQDIANVIQAVLRGASHPGRGMLATLLGMVALFFGASGVFSELRNSLNKIWHAPPRKGGGLRRLFRDRMVSFAMVLGIGFLLMVLLIVSAGLAALGKSFGSLLPLPAWLLDAGDIVLSAVLVTLLFGLIYRFVPDATLEWRFIWIGAAITSLLFTTGKFLIGLYLGKAGVGSAYGAAASVVVLLAWIYYSSQVFFFGAELTKSYADASGLGVARPPH